MSNHLLSETHEDFVKRMDVERVELGHALRSKNYKRASVIAAYISNSILARIKHTEEASK